MSDVNFNSPFVFTQTSDACSSDVVASYVNLSFSGSEKNGFKSTVNSLPISIVWLGTALTISGALFSMIENVYVFLVVKKSLVAVTTSVCCPPPVIFETPS